MNRAPNARVFFLIGLVLTPGLGYVIAFDALDRPDTRRISSVYVATPIDFENDSAMTDRFGDELSLEPSEFDYDTEEYRAPNRTSQILVTAIQNGTATTSNQTVQTDLDVIQRKYPFLVDPSDDYYNYTVTTASGTETIEATPTNDSQVAAVGREHVRSRTVAYANLSAAEQRTFRKIRNATESEPGYGYQPWSNESVPTPAFVAYNGSYYVVRAAGNHDAIRFPDGLLLGLGATLVGVLSLLVGSGIVLLESR